MTLEGISAQIAKQQGRQAHNRREGQQFGILELPDGSLPAKWISFQKHSPSRKSSAA